MWLTLKIAWRNIWRHKGKSFVIGFILFLGALLMTVGNGVINGTEAGLQKNIIDRFVGDLVLVSQAEEKDDVFFSPGGKSLKVIKDYPSVKEMMAGQDYVENFLPLTRGIGMLLNDEGDPWMTFIIGANFDDYREMFEDNIEPVDGELLTNSSRGMLITGFTQARIYRQQFFWPLPEGVAINEENLSEKALENKDNLLVKNDLVVMGMSDSNFDMDVRVPVTGVIKFKELNNVWQMISFMDIESYRECFGYVTAADNTVELSADQEMLLGEDNLDDLFSEDELFGDAEMGDATYDLSFEREDVKKDNTGLNLDEGAYNIVAVKLKDGVSIAKATEMLNAAIEASGVDARVIPWDKAVGSIADFTKMFQVALLVFVWILFFVAAIIIMNTLSMAALERVGEIGMMRAVGAQKSFIAKLFISETSILSAIFGGIGIVVGVIIIITLGILNISAGDNDMLNFLFGGDTFQPIASFAGVFLGIIQLAIVTLIAMLYPVRIARKITPLEAISRD